MSLLDGYQIIYVLPKHLKYKKYSGNAGKKGRSDGHNNDMPGGSGCYRHPDCFTCPDEYAVICDGGEKSKKKC